MRVHLPVAALFVLCTIVVALARPVPVPPSIEQLVAQSDLVVLATAVSSENVTNLDDRMPPGRPESMILARTVFMTAVSLKGGPAGKQIVLLHLHAAKSPNELPPDLQTGIFFDLTGKTMYMLFLKQRSDGICEPANGQSEPETSVRRVEQYAFPATTQP